MSANGKPGQTPRNSTAALQANLRALRRYDHNASAASAVAHATALETVRPVSSKTALPVAVAVGASGEITLHSRYDPVREADRAVESLGDGGFFVVLGLGLGYHLEALSRARSPDQVLILESDARLARSLCAMRDFSASLADQRVHIRIAPQPDEIETLIRDRYVPAVHGGMELLVLQGARRLSPQWYDSVSRVLRQATEAALAEYHTQRKLGRRWFMNMLVNLRSAQTHDSEEFVNLRARLPRERKTLVLAAGPSLRAELPRLRETRGEYSVVATDSTLPVLSAVGLEPDIVVSIDCQQAGYHHLLDASPGETVSVLDLASPPLLLRSFRRRVMVSGAHPLARYLATRLEWPPHLDLSGGSVTYAALALALELGIEEIELLGADFGYPARHPYCVETYLDRYFRTRVTRTAPLEHLHLEFVFNEPGLARDHEAGGERYTAPRMRRYREAVSRLAARYGRTLVADERAPGRYRVVSRTSAPGSFAPSERFHREPGAASSERAGTVLREYRDALERLRPSEPYHKFVAELSPPERELWSTLLPLLPAFFREQDRRGLTGAERALRWALGRLNLVLERDPGVADDGVAADEVETGVITDKSRGAGSE